MLHALGIRFSDCAAAHAAVAECDAALTRAEEQLLRSSGTKAQNMNQEMVRDMDRGMARGRRW